MHDIDDIASRHGVPAEAAEALFHSLVRGGGRSAQFDHPALGGMGQWGGGGMLMIGSMFDHALKARVAALCEDLAPLAATQAKSSWASTGGWWPQELGAPSSAGSQNMRVTPYFPNLGA